MKITSNEWNAMVFEQRNKIYGAYELRTHYHTRLLRSALIVITLTGMLIWIAGNDNKPVALHPELNKDPVVFYDLSDLDFQQVIQTVASTVTQVADPNTYKPVARVPVEPMEIKTDPVPVETGSETGPVVAQMSGTAITGTGTGVSDIPVTVSLASVDVAPEFPGGIDRFYDYLMNRIRFTDKARRLGITGKVHVKFIVSEDGSINGIEVLKGLDESLDGEVITALKNSPLWAPGKLQGQAVKTIMHLPVSFSLKGNF